VPSALHSEPATETFGPEGGTLELADGATLEVPEGAFSEDTELTVAIIDLDYGEDVESARVYTVSPEGGLGVLRAPLLLTAAEIGDEAFSLRFEDGEYQYLDFAENGKLAFTISNPSEELIRRSQGVRARIVPDDDVFAGAVFVCAALFADAINEPNPELREIAGAALFHCMLLFGFGVCEDAAAEAGLDPSGCGGVDETWVDHVVEQTRSDLERANVDEGEIEPMLEALAGCLSEWRTDGKSRPVALAACESRAPVPVPGEATQTQTATATATATQTDAPETDAPGTEAPAAPLISFVAKPTGVIVDEDSLPCVLWPDDTCREYRVTFRVGWSGLTVPASIECKPSGRPGQTISAGPPSGDELMQLQVLSWQFETHPLIFCELHDGSGSLLDFVSAQVKL